MNGLVIYFDDTEKFWTELGISNSIRLGLNAYLPRIGIVLVQGIG